MFGTIEEQMYYILLLPALMSLCLFAAGITWNRVVWRKLGVAVMCAALLANASGLARGAPGGLDDGTARCELGGDARPPTAVVSSTDGTSQFLAHSRNHRTMEHGATLLRARTPRGLRDPGHGAGGTGIWRCRTHIGAADLGAAGPSRLCHERRINDGSLRVYDVRGISGTRE